MKKRNLASLPRSVEIFVDASILALHFTEHGALTAACTAFLERCACGEVQAYTFVIAVSETIHRVIVSEAIRRFGLEPRKAVSSLKQHPGRVRALREHLGIASEVYRLGVDILTVSYIDLHASKRVRRDYGLMTNDSLIVAVMGRHHLVHLATHDTDFEQVPGIKVWMP